MNREALAENVRLLPFMVLAKRSAKLASTLQAGHGFGLVAFFDDNPDLHGSEIAGVEVYSPARFANVLEQERFTTVLLSIPSSSRKRRLEIVSQIESYRLSVKTVPSTVDLVSGASNIDDIREVEIEELLGRGAMHPVPRLLALCIRDKSVMVTGAGGSIGSELCRQILIQKPKRLVLFESSEFALYQIE